MTTNTNWRVEFVARCSRPPLPNEMWSEINKLVDAPVTWEGQTWHFKEALHRLGHVRKVPCGGMVCGCRGVKGDWCLCLVEYDRAYERYLEEYVILYLLNAEGLQRGTHRLPPLQPPHIGEGGGVRVKDLGRDARTFVGIALGFGAERAPKKVVDGYVRVSHGKSPRHCYVFEG